MIEIEPVLKSACKTSAHLMHMPKYEGILYLRTLEVSEICIIVKHMRTQIDSNPVHARTDIWGGPWKPARVLIL
jgi:hypothetical protein